MTKRFRVPNRLRTKLEEIGIAPAAVLLHAGLPADLFDAERVLVTTEELFALWSGIGALSIDPATGIKLGTETKAEHCAPVVLAALSTDTFGAAIAQLGRYKLLTCPEEVLEVVDDGEWRIQFRWLLAAGEEPELLTETCFATLLSIGRIGTGARLCPVPVELVRPHPHLRTLEQHFGCSVATRAPHNALVFCAEDAKRPFVTRNAELLSMLAPQFEAELVRSGGAATFPDRVRSAIQARLAGRRPAVDDVASALHLSSRTLQRRLRESGSSFNAYSRKRATSWRVTTSATRCSSSTRPPTCSATRTRTRSSGPFACGRAHRPPTGANINAQRRRNLRSASR